MCQKILSSFLGITKIYTIMLTLKQDIILLGFRGVGKSTLGNHMANKYHIPFIDSDVLLQKKLGVPLSTYAEKEGIESFREKEFLQLEEIFSEKKREKRIIVLGGGFVDYEQSYKKIKNLSHTKKILLEMEIEKLWERLQSFTEEEKRVGEIHTKKDFYQLYKKRKAYFQDMAENCIFLLWSGKESIQKNLNILEKSIF